MVNNTVYKNETVNNVVNVDGGTTVNESVVNKNKSKTVTVDGNTSVHVNASYTAGSSSKVQGTLSYDYSSLSAAKKAVNSMFADCVEEGRGGYTMKNSQIVDGKYKATVNGSYGYGTYTMGTLQSESVSDLSKSDRQKDGKAKVVDVSTELTNSKTKEKVTTSTTSSTTSSVDVKEDTSSYSTTSSGNCTTTYKLVGIDYNFSNDSIMLGETDNYANAHMAQGSVDKLNHYDQTNTYTIINTVYNTTVVTTTTTNTTTNTTNTTIDRTTTNTYTTTTTKQQDYCYTADVNVNVTPIVLDLDGDGKIEASKGQYLPHKGDFSEHVAMFDFYGDGFPVVCEWVGTNDGLLCRPDADGSVKGTNLFGNANGYDNGYDELSTLDKDHSGALEGEELAGLMVWSDANHNGVADKGELQSVQELGITSIGVDHDNFCGSFTRNGQSFKSFDWFPAVSRVRKVGVAQS